MEAQTEQDKYQWIKEKITFRFKSPGSSTKDQNLISNTNDIIKQYYFVITDKKVTYMYPNQNG